MARNADPHFPTNRDLIDQISFDTEHGKIWLHEQRMLLTHSSLFANLRRELIKTLGSNRARSLLTRLGYLSGWRDAELARKLRPELSTADAFFAGPQLALIKGMVNVKPLQLDFDVGSGAFYAEFEWFDAYEAELHLQEFGPVSEPVCWLLTGYASGFTTYYMGHKIFYKEVECLGCGAQRCRIVGKPAEQWDDREELERVLLPDAMADELLSLQSQFSQLQDSVRQTAEHDDLVANSVGRSTSFRHACQLLQRAAQGPVTVLLQGETGVGKEIFAKGLHLSSARARQPFIAVNCACIPADLIEAELFGVEKGAFTGAHASREGKFERAHGGTLFLDEVVELTPRAQASLLRVLQEGELERVGGSEVRRVDVRVVAASNENLGEAVKTGKFRADLFYRLNIYPVHIPALRERKDDIPLLIEHFLGKYQALYNKRIPGTSDKAMRALMEYNWPGNIRELENMVERGVILTDNNQLIDLPALFPSLAEAGQPLERIDPTGHLKPVSTSPENDSDALCEALLSEDFDLEQFEIRLLRTAISKTSGNVSKAARLLGLSRAQLAYRLEKLKD
ncbi:sigma 54-interacting transcriptional regulator [Pseudomonas lalucatii]|uniref:Sigma 54-interacting transcriptional regulator n=1 Tax=Pseudomonas lalucatii TaxID=1424203 RepID=A0ABS5PX52_9PSED|nr:sigma-54-dependent Fis family transcriptional regulator [Pseudomonas lalucatii]MBS7661060.1 sigma 54-interacting transcriptional regulator [Pseudomonas lalucatii]MBS7724301.1 sigma 54-interacting transcriptional regulator [Pseudomonas lalucatii]QVM87708.1 sigma 54-interacting transcriptional regulator [Pseudomonas lalucatii]